MARIIFEYLSKRWGIGFSSSLGFGFLAYIDYNELLQGLNLTLGAVIAVLTIVGQVKKLNSKTDDTAN